MGACRRWPGLAAVRSRLLAQAREHFRHVIARLQDGFRDEHWSLGFHGENERVAGAGVNFGDLAGHRTVLTEQDPGEEDAVFDINDYDMDDRGVQAQQKVEHQVMRLGAVRRLAGQGALQGFADGGVDLDDHGLVLGHEEYRRTSLGGDDFDAGDGYCLQLAHAAKCVAQARFASPRCIPTGFYTGLP